MATRRLRRARGSASQPLTPLQHEVNRAFDQLENHSRPPLLTPGFSSAGQVRLHPPPRRPESFWIRVTDAPTGGAYPWLEIEDDGTGGWVDKVDGRGGTDTVNPAYEFTGATDAATGTPFRAYPAVDRESVVFLKGDSGGGGGIDGITVWEADGTPTVADVTDLVFDQADGFTVTDLTGGFVQIDQADATVSQAGKVSTGNQTFKGAKDFNIGSSPSYCIGLKDIASQLFAALTVAGTVDTSPVLVIRTVTSAGVLKNQLNLDNNGLNLNTGVYSLGASTGVSGTFTTVDGKTVTVTGGIITSIT